MTGKREGHHVIDVVERLAKRFRDDLVVIGGVAVYLHTKEFDEKVLPTEFTHDADMAVALAALPDLRSDYELITNHRLNKRQIEVEDVEVDIYVDHQSSLRFEFNELAPSAETIDQIRVASLPQLLLLKLSALADRWKTDHGKKDRRDVAKLMVMMEDADPTSLIDGIDDNDLDLMKRVLASGAFTDIAKRNASIAAKLRRRAAVILDGVNDLLEDV